MKRRINTMIEEIQKRKLAGSIEIDKKEISLAKI